MADRPFCLLIKQADTPPNMSQGLNASFTNTMKNGVKNVGEFGRTFGQVMGERGSVGEQIGKGIANTTNTGMGALRTARGLASTAIATPGAAAGYAAEKAVGPNPFSTATRTFTNEFGVKPLQSGFNQLMAGLGDETQDQRANRVGGLTENNRLQQSRDILHSTGHSGQVPIMDAANTIGETAGVMAAGGMGGNAALKATAGSKFLPQVMRQAAGAAASGAQPVLAGRGVLGTTTGAVTGAGTMAGVNEGVGYAEEADQLLTAKQQQQQQQQPDPVIPGTEQVLQSLQQDPDAMEQKTQQAGQRLQQLLTSQPEMAAEAQNAIQTGQVGPETEAKGKGFLEQLFGDPAVAQETWDGMSGVQKFLTATGMGVGLVSLISAISGGGAGGWLGTLLGLGTAAGGLAIAGVFGEEAQQGVNGGMQSLRNLVTPQTKTAPDPAAQQAAPSQPTQPPAQQPQPAQQSAAAGGGLAGGMTSPLADMFGESMQFLPDQNITKILHMLPEIQPEIAKNLDKAAGIGWQNALMSGIGSMTGELGKQLEEAGIPADQQPRLLELWRQVRQK